MRNRNSLLRRRNRGRKDELMEQNTGKPFVSRSFAADSFQKSLYMPNIVTSISSLLYTQTRNAVSINFSPTKKCIPKFAEKCVSLVLQSARQKCWNFVIDASRLTNEKKMCRCVKMCNMEFQLQVEIQGKIERERERERERQIDRERERYCRRERQVGREVERGMIKQVSMLGCLCTVISPEGNTT